MGINNLSSNRLRMTGLNSGLDTTSIITNLMNAERMSVNKIYRSKTKSEWKLESYTKINSDLMTFSNKYLSALSKDSVMSAGAYMNYGANYRENSSFKVTGSAGIIPGNYNISSTKMAQYAQIAGPKDASKMTQVSGKMTGQYKSEAISDELKIAGGANATGTTKLKDVVKTDGTNAFGFSADVTEIKFKINGKEVAINDTDDINSMISKIDALTADTKVDAEFDGGKITFTSMTNAMVFGNVSGQPAVFGAGTVFGEKISGTVAFNIPKFDVTDSLEDISKLDGAPNFLGGGTTLEFKINGEIFSFDKSKTLKDVIDEVNTRTGDGTRMYFDFKSGEFSVRSTTANAPITVSNDLGNMFGANSVVGIDDQTVSKVTTISSADTLRQVANKMGEDIELDADGKFSFEINGKKFSFDKETTLSKVMTAVNSSDAGVRMSYSNLTDSFTFTATKIGSDGEVNLANVVGSNAFGANGIFGILDSTLSSVGTDASITINNKIITKSSNNFTVDGMNFEITGDFTATDPSADGYNVTFTHDLGSTVDKVKAFIEDYNKMVKELSGLLKEKKEYKFSPLLAEEEEGLTEKEIENWTAKAKSGIMRSDPVISSLLSNLRSAAYSIVGESGTMASQIGITTAGTDGTLKLDEDVFKKALTDNPSKVAQVMTNTSDKTEPEDKYKESGFTVRLFSSMSQYRSNTRANQIQDETKKINNFETKITAMEKKLIIKEERYWRKYSALETLMGNMNSQSDWLTSQLGALQK